MKEFMTKWIDECSRRPSDWHNILVMQPGNYKLGYFGRRANLNYKKST